MIITGKFPALRLRRNRKFEWTRRLIQESSLSTNDLILPIFLTDGKNKAQPIKTMPGIKRYTIDKLTKVIDVALSHKIPMVALFPYTNNKIKDEIGSESLNENNLVCKATRLIKKKVTTIVLKMSYFLLLVRKYIKIISLILLKLQKQVWLIKRAYMKLMVSAVQR